MDKLLEIEVLLRQKIKEVGKKSSARKIALKRLEKAYLLQSQELERRNSLYECLLKDYNNLQLVHKELQRDAERLEQCLENMVKSNEKLMKETISTPKKSGWKFWL